MQLCRRSQRTCGCLGCSRRPASTHCLAQDPSYCLEACRQAIEVSPCDRRAPRQPAMQLKSMQHAGDGDRAGSPLIALASRPHPLRSDSSRSLRYRSSPLRTVYRNLVAWSKKPHRRQSVNSSAPAGAGSVFGNLTHGLRSMRLSPPSASPVATHLRPFGTLFGQRLFSESLSPRVPSCLLALSANSAFSSCFLPIEPQRRNRRVVVEAALRRQRGERGHDQADVGGGV